MGVILPCMGWGWLALQFILISRGVGQGAVVELVEIQPAETRLTSGAQIAGRLAPINIDSQEDERADRTIWQA